MTDLEKLRVTVAFLEASDVEYTLTALIHRSKLAKEVVMSLLQSHWINEALNPTEELSIVNLALTSEEQVALRYSHPQ